MSTSHALLAVLEREPAHGYTLKQTFDAQFSRARPLAFGQVYAALGRFERQGWATSLEPEAGDGPERKRYQITTDGSAAVDEWVFTPQLPGEFAASTLLARVTAALMSGRPAADVLDQQRTFHLARMRELTAIRRDADTAGALAATYELNHLDADLRWIDEAGRRLDALAATLNRTEETR